MYEGKEHGNAMIFSSIENTVVPLVEMQAYILPISDVLAIEETLTSKGITTKHLLVASSQGSVLDLPLHMVDPRRPALSTPAHLREPGIPPTLQRSHPQREHPRQQPERGGHQWVGVHCPGAGVWHGPVW